MTTVASWRRWGIVGFRRHPRLGEALGILDRLARIHEARLVLHPDLTSALDETQSPPGCLRTSAATFSHRCDIVLSLGGDGTFLSAARLVEGRGTPLLGINLGKLGFLADLSVEDLEDVLPRVLGGERTIEHRARLEAGVHRSGSDPIMLQALNEIALQSRRPMGMVELDVQVGDEPPTVYWADGLLVATPTGSTAYSLALGGPILHPSVEALLLTPQAPHVLTVRPMIVSDRQEIRVRTTTAPGVRVLHDGRLGFTFRPGDEVRIRRSPHDLTIVRPAGLRFGAILQGKLGWSGAPVPGSGGGRAP